MMSSQISSFSGLILISTLYGAFLDPCTRAFTLPLTICKSTTAPERTYLFLVRYDWHNRHIVQYFYTMPCPTSFCDLPSIHNNGMHFFSFVFAVLTLSCAFLCNSSMLICEYCMLAVQYFAIVYTSNLNKSISSFVSSSVIHFSWPEARMEFASSCLDSINLSIFLQ